MSVHVLWFMDHSLYFYHLANSIGPRQIVKMGVKQLNCVVCCPKGLFFSIIEKHCRFKYKVEHCHRISTTTTGQGSCYVYLNARQHVSDTGMYVDVYTLFIRSRLLRVCYTIAKSGAPCMHVQCKDSRQVQAGPT